MKIEILFSIPCSRNYFQKEKAIHSRKLPADYHKNIMTYDEGRRR